MANEDKDAEVNLYRLDFNSLEEIYLNFVNKYKAENKLTKLLRNVLMNRQD